MKIVHVFKDFYPPLAAGITRYIHDVAVEAACRGAEVEVHVAGVHRSRRDELAGGVIVHRHREFGRLLSSPLAPGLPLEVRALRADVIHVHMPNPLGELGALLNRKAPLVVSFHAQLGRQRALEPIYGPLRRRVLDRAAEILVSSERMGQAPELCTAAGKTRVLPYGVSPGLVDDGDRVTPRDDKLRVLFVGRLVYYKGLDVLLRAVARVDAARLTIVGDGPDRRPLEAMTDRLGLRDRVGFLGLVDDQQLRVAYREHDVLVLPSVSRAEAFGLAAAEAMANGLPVISTALGTGTDWVNIDGESGLVTRANDPDALADALDRLRCGELRRQLGDGARRRAETHFSFHRHMDALMDSYLRVAA